MSELIAKYLEKLKEMMSGKSHHRSMMGDGRSMADLDLSLHRDFISSRKAVSL